MFGKLFSIERKFNKSGTAGEISIDLGLALCNELIAKHGETIRVSSKVGK